MKYLRLFKTTAAYDAAIDDLGFPNVSHCEDNKEVHYNLVSPPLFVKLYLNNGEVVKLEGSGELTQSMISQYKLSTVSAKIGELCTSIGQNAFNGYTRLTSVTIGNGVISIGNFAFQNCTNLTSITIPNSVTNIGEDVFSGTAWYNNQPDGLVYAGKVAYKYKGTMPENITIKNGTLGIAGRAFSHSSGLKSVIIPDSVTNIGAQTFYGCSGLTNITIGNGVTSIGHGAFNVCSGLTSITIPDSVINIGSSAFQSCSRLTSVIIGSGVTSIDEFAFFECTGLTSITSRATTAPTIGSSTFRNIKRNGTLYVPIGSTGYNVWMGTGNYYLGKYSWTKVEQ